MLDWLADLGLGITRWSERAHALIFYGYCVTFGISGFLGEWLRRRAKARRSVPRAVVRFWIPVLFHPSAES